MRMLLRERRCWGENMRKRNEMIREEEPGAVKGMTETVREKDRKDSYMMRIVKVGKIREERMRERKEEKDEGKKSRRMR